jgi:glycosyl transferase family 25
MKIYYINLAHRTDRKNQIEDMLQTHGLLDDTIRIEALYIPLCGALGCSLSHIKALKTFIADTTQDTCVILEDDFEFNKDKSLNDAITLIKNTGLDWDVLLLASNTLRSLPISGQPIDFCKCIASLTTAAYMVNRHYAQTLLNNFMQGARMLQASQKTPAIDVYWQQLQMSHDWYIYIIGHQRVGYSDIENRICDYNGV